MDSNFESGFEVDVSIELPYQRHSIAYQRLVLFLFCIATIIVLAVSNHNLTMTMNLPTGGVSEVYIHQNPFMKYLIVEGSISAFYILVSMIISFKSHNKPQKGHPLAPIYWFAVFDLLFIATRSTGAGAATGNLSVNFSSLDSNGSSNITLYASNLKVYTGLSFVSMIQNMAIVYRTISSLTKKLHK